MENKGFADVEDGVDGVQKLTLPPAAACYGMLQLARDGQDAAAAAG